MVRYIFLLFLGLSQARAACDSGIFTNEAVEHAPVKVFYLANRKKPTRALGEEGDLTERGRVIALGGRPYHDVIRRRLTVVDGSDRYELEPKQMRSLWLRIRTQPRPGDLFRLDSGYTSDVLQIQAVSAAGVSYANLLNGRRATIAPGDWAKWPVFPAIPGGFVFPFSAWDFNFQGPKSWVIDHANAPTEILGLESGHSMRLGIANMLGLETGEDWAANLKRYPLGVFDFSFMRAGAPIARLEDKLGQLDQLVLAQSPQRRTEIARGGRAYDATIASLRELYDEMRLNPQPGDEFLMPKYGIEYVVARDGKRLVLANANEGDRSEWLLGDFARANFSPLLPSGMEFPRQHGSTKALE
jgi:hypothetical protein